MPAVSKGEQSKLWSHMGECYYALQEPGEAFSAYHRALELNPNNYSARLKLGELYLAGGAAEQAERRSQEGAGLGAARAPTPSSCWAPRQRPTRMSRWPWVLFAKPCNLTRRG